ncbi:MAG TPA: hypothetical protein VEH57_01540 [Thermoplasmata archaeon]|nr:hypothetical protein [Thermoplasmata archaeon]
MIWFVKTVSKKVPPQRAKERRVTAANETRPAKKTRTGRRRAEPERERIGRRFGKRAVERNPPTAAASRSFRRAR